MYVVYWQYVIRVYYTDVITHNGMVSLKFDKLNNYSQTKILVQN